MKLATCLGMESIINLSKYPIDQPNSTAALEFMQNAHDTFQRDGILALPGFLYSDMVTEIVEELRPKLDMHSMCECDVEHNIYQYDDPDPFYPATHPRNALMHSKFHNLPNDEIPESSVLRRVYNWDMMTRFISTLIYGQISNPPLLYHLDDPLAALTCNVLFDNNIVDWHFDQAPFTVIILLQNGIVGGEYEVAPETLYADGQYDYDLHEDIIHDIGLENKVKSYRFNPGDLIVHRGTHSIHRVTTVFGGRPRMSALFEYAQSLGERLSDSVRQSTYCRSEALEYCQVEDEENTGNSTIGHKW